MEEKLRFLKIELAKEEARVKLFGKKLEWYETKLKITLFLKKQFEQIKTYLEQSGDGEKIS